MEGGCRKGDRPGSDGGRRPSVRFLERVRGAVGQTQRPLPLVPGGRDGRRRARTGIRRRAALRSDRGVLERGHQTSPPLGETPRGGRRRPTPPLAPPPLPGERPGRRLPGGRGLDPGPRRPPFPRSAPAPGSAAPRLRPRGTGRGRPRRLPLAARPSGPGPRIRPGRRGGRVSGGPGRRGRGRKILETAGARHRRGLFRGGTERGATGGSAGAAGRDREVGRRVHGAAA
mmetsp:Transcript_39068/g.90971  ORF Transcript_39068/g.90971 Transcript_39068/m.90971 type:complete len:229 (+) Transcript_39068:1711-2397(+)